jgi:DMSO/TMAO reductase YedYZ heme-binding membrane subunit
VVDTRHRGRQVLRQVAIAAGIVLVLILLVLAFSR